MSKNIVVLGFNASATVEMIFQAPGKDLEKKTAVLIAEVAPAKNGALVDGEDIKIILPNGKTIQDRISSLKDKGKNIVVAHPGMEIEICLAQTQFQELE